MNGFFFDENLPAKILFTPSLPIIIVTKDADFSDRLMLDFSPAKVVHLRFGNMQKRQFHQFLARI